MTDLIVVPQTTEWQRLKALVLECVSSPITKRVYILGLDELNAPDITTTKGLRDRAIIAVLLGCGLRRSEVAALTMGHVRQRDGRWCIVDLLGKHGRVRTVPMPVWVKVAIDAWTAPAGVAGGYVFRPVNRANQVVGERLSEKVVWQMLRPYATAAGVPGIAPHDCRRTAAKLCRAAGGELEQIQLLLGHASVQTTSGSCRNQPRFRARKPRVAPSGSGLAVWATAIFRSAPALFIPVKVG
jgi:integrase